MKPASTCFSLGIVRALSLITALALSGCSDPLKNYDKTVADGITSISFAAQFKEVFPHSFHFIIHYAFKDGSSAWESKVGIADRYVLKMQIPIIIDRAKGRVTKFGSPEFYLNEVTSVSNLPDGRFIIKYGRGIRFGADDWQRFVSSHGDLSIFGVTTPIEPIPRFNEIIDAA